MTRSEFNRAFRLADKRDVELSDADDSHLHGCALPAFTRTPTTIAPVAKMIRWHCLMLNGEWDHDALHELQSIARSKLELVGAGSDQHENSFQRREDVIEILSSFWK